MGAIGWPEFLALLTSVGFGVLSAVFPLANAETYVVASQMSAAAGVVPIAVGIGIGQTIGKTVLFLAVRRGRQSRLFHRPADRAGAQPPGALRQRARRVISRLLVLVGTKRWGLPIVFLAAVVGIPPLYGVALLAGATKMKLGYFVALVLVGRLARFALVAMGVHFVHL